MSKLSDLQTALSLDKTVTYQSPNMPTTTSAPKVSKLQALQGALSNNDQDVIKQFSSIPVQEIKTPNPEPHAFHYLNGAAGFHQIEQATKDDQVDWQKLADRKQAEVDALRVMTNPEYSSDYTENIAELGAQQLRLKEYKDKAEQQKAAFMSQPNTGLTDSEKQAETMKAAADKSNGNIFQQAWHVISPTDEQKKYDAYVNSEDYIKQNWNRWIELANKPVLTTAERDEAMKASQVLDTVAGKLKGFWEKDTDQSKNYESLSDLLASKYNAVGSAMVGQANAMLPGASAIVESNWARQGRADNVSDPQLKSSIMSNNITRNYQTTSPLAYTAGTIGGGVASMEAASAALGTLGVSSQTARNAIIFGAQNMANGIANGEDAGKVIGDTITGVIGGAAGSKVGEIVSGSVMRGLYESGLSNKAIQVMASTSSGLSFAATSTAAEEAKRAIYEGKNYSPDVTGISVNLITAALFGTLEAFKSNPTTAAKASELQEKLQSNDPVIQEAAKQEAVIFLNDVTKQENIVNSLEKDLQSNPLPDSVSAADNLDRRRQIQQNNYANAREMLSKMESENQAITLANQYLTSDTLHQMEESGAMPFEISALRRAYNKAFQIQQRINWLNQDPVGNANEIAQAERSLKIATDELSMRKDAVANYLSSSPTAKPYSLQAEQGASQGVLNASESTQSAGGAQGYPGTEPTFSRTQEPQNKGYMPLENESATDSADKLIIKPTKAGVTPPPSGEIPEGQVERGFTHNVRTDEAMNTDVRSAFDTSPESYKQLANADTLAKAEAIFSKGTDQALTYLNQKIGAGKLSPEDVPLSRMIANDLAKRGNVDGARSVISDVAQQLTEAGQLTQAASILRNADPISVENTIQKSLDKINTELQKKGSKYRARLTDEEIQEINNTDFSDQANFEDLYTRIAQRIGREMGSTMWEKLTEIRRIAMLLNPKTQIRNVAGNIPLAGMRKVSEHLAGGIQDILVKMGALDPEKQTRTFLVSRESKNIARQLFDIHQKDLLGNSNKWDMSSLVRQYRKYFGKSGAGKVVDAIRGFTYELLEKGDAPFLKSAFVDNAAQYIEAHGYKSLDEVPREAIEFASQQALEATFRDASALARLMNQMKSKGGIGGGVLDLLLPFTTTPINIAKRTYEYSPLGALKVVSDIITHADGVKIIDDITKTLTGSAVVALGFYLKGMGAITGKQDKDSDMAAFNRASGNAPYSFAGKVSYDWLQPVGSLLAMGAAVSDAVRDNPGVTDAITDSLVSSGDAFLNMTFFQNVMNLFKGYGSVTENIVNTAFSGLLGQVTPSVLGATARTIDDTVRSSKSGQGPVRDAVNAVIQKTPFASESLPPSVNIKGEENKRLDSPVARFFQEFFNPANVNTGSQNKIDQQLQDLYETTGNKTIFPRSAPSSINGAALTGAELAQYQKTMGQTTYTLLQQVFSSPGYSSLSDAEKVKAVNEILDYASAQAKSEYQSTHNQAITQDVKPINPLALPFKEAYNDVTNSKGTDSKPFVDLTHLYMKMPQKQQTQVSDAFGTDANTFKNLVSALGAGISAATFFAWKGKLATYNKMMKSYEANDQWRKDLNTDKTMSVSQKNLLDNLLINDITIIPQDKNVNYSSQSTFTVSQMSDSAQKNYNKYLNGKVSADIYSKVYDFSSSATSDKDKDGKEIKGHTKRDKVLSYINKLNLTPSQKDALYYAFEYSPKTLSEAPWH